MIRFRAIPTYVPVAVYLRFDPNGEVTEEFQDVDENLTPETCKLGEAFAFCIATCRALELVDQPPGEPILYRVRDPEDPGPTMYRPECEFGSAADFLLKWPEDRGLISFVGTADGELMVMIPHPFGPQGCERHYIAREEDSVLLSSTHSAVESQN